MNARPLLVYSREDLLRVNTGRAKGVGVGQQDKPVNNNGTLTKNGLPVRKRELMCI